MKPIDIAIVGLGQRTFKKALSAITNEPKHWRLVAAIDPVEEQRVRLNALFPDVSTFANLQELLEWNRSENEHPRFEAVYIAVPHHCYREILPDILSLGIHVLKEKPAAMSPEELSCYHGLADSNSAILTTASQRRYGIAMAQMKIWMERIGNPSTFEAQLKLCIPNLGEGWRARSSLAGGGAFADVGWHLLDMIIGLANPNDEVVPVVEYSKLFYVRPFHGQDCEDGAHIVLGFPNSSQEITAHLTISRIGHQATEQVIITGEKGVLVFNGREISVHFEPGAATEPCHCRLSDASYYETDVTRMFRDFYIQVSSVLAGSLPSSITNYTAYRIRDKVVTRTLQAIYQRTNNGGPNIQPLIKHPSLASEPLSMEWPIIDEALEKEMSNQLHTSISIYGNGGVFKDFETEFKNYHDAKSSYAPLHNSGTNALHALYFAVGSQQTAGIASAPLR
ncbi:MAG: hypothetical protein Q9192_003769 [Flavoplaca navasiana]